VIVEGGGGEIIVPPRFFTPRAATDGWIGLQFITLRAHFKHFENLKIISER
jgi:hypothetical protein